MTEVLGTPEKKVVVEDNARKFRIEHIDVTQFLDVTSYLLTTDWIVTEDDSEEKIVHKAFNDGSVKILHIVKQTVDSKRTSVKREISQEEYGTRLKDSVRKVVKTRSEFTYIQNDNLYEMKYDEFQDSDVCILEVDSKSDEIRERFDPTVFPFRLDEKTGNIHYYGYRIEDVINGNTL